MPSAGELLRQERLKRNRSLSELASETCISTRYLEALEADDLKTLPGQFFYRSFLKQYASALQLDESTTDRILASAEPVAEEDPLPMLRAAYNSNLKDEAHASRNRPSTILIATLFVGVLVACTGLYALWQNVQTRPEASMEAAAPAPSAQPSLEDDRSREEDNVQRARAQEPLAHPESPPVAQKAEAPAEAPLLPMEAGKFSVDLAATEQVWVRLSAEGKNIFTGTLDASETRTFSLEQNTKLLTGNAGGIDVRWNGKPIGPIGPRGQIRVVIFSPEKFEIVTPRPAVSGT